MLAQCLARLRVHDRAGNAAFGAHFLDDLGVIAIGHKADVLAVGLGRIAKARALRQFAHLRFWHAAQGKAQIIKLSIGGGKEEIGLVARWIMGLVQLRSVTLHHSPDIMAGRKAIGVKLARHGEHIGKFWAHIAADAGYRRSACEVIIGKLIDHFVAKGAFMVKDIMRNAKAVAHRAGVFYVITSAAGTFAACGSAIVIKLQSDADDFGSAGRCQGCYDRAIDPA